MNGFDYGQLSVITNIWLVLFIFGYFYNMKVNQLGHRAEGWVWLEVVIGVIVTQIGIGCLDVVLNWNAFYLGILAYTASGLPMIAGAVKRYLEDHERARKAMHE
jgi:heme A synthase